MDELIQIASSGHNSNNINLDYALHLVATAVHVLTTKFSIVLEYMYMYHDTVRPYLQRYSLLGYDSLSMAAMYTCFRFIIRILNLLLNLVGIAKFGNNTAVEQG